MPWVQPEVNLKLRSLIVDRETGARDRLSWKGSSNGEFTVSSAYSLLTWDGTPRVNWSHMFTRVWRVMVPERVRVFLWLGIHQVIMTNMERQRRHLTDSGICPVCKGGNETIMHIFRDCPAMEGIWQRLVPPRRRREFFEQTLLVWMYENLGNHDTVGDSPWSTLFAISVWWSWKWRCGNVFGVNGKCRDRVQFLKGLAKEVVLANKNGDHETTQTKGRVERLVAWLRPVEGWMKVNTDGASRGNPGLATAGGVLRNERGEWCLGYAVNIGICSAPLAELWGVYYGLVIAWEYRVTKVEVEVDSEVVVGFFKTGIEESHPLSFLVRLCYGFLTRDWIVRISHVYREANRLADGLANYAFTLPLGFHKLDVAPEIVNSIIEDDANGVSTSRQVQM